MTRNYSLRRSFIIHNVAGEGNLIEEQSEIVNKCGDNEDQSENVHVMIIGNNNVFEVGSVCHSLKIGDSNILEAKSYVGRDTNLSNGCIVGAGCRQVLIVMLAPCNIVHCQYCV